MYAALLHNVCTDRTNLFPASQPHQPVPGPDQPNGLQSLFDRLLPHVRQRTGHLSGRQQLQQLRSHRLHGRHQLRRSRGPDELQGGVTLRRRPEGVGAVDGQLKHAMRGLRGQHVPEQHVPSVGDVLDADNVRGRQVRQHGHDG